MISDPAKKQYFMFSIIVSIILMLGLNYLLPGVVDAMSTFGYPLSTADAAGAGKFLIQSFNGISMGLMLSVPMYYIIFWLLSKR